MNDQSERKDSSDALPQAVQELIEAAIQRLAERQAVAFGRSDAGPAMQLIAQFGLECAEAALELGRAQAPAPTDLTVSDVNAINALMVVAAHGRIWEERKRIADLQWKLTFIGQRAESASRRVSLAACDNTECPVGCPDSHALPFGDATASTGDPDV